MRVIGLSLLLCATIAAAAEPRPVVGPLVTNDRWPQSTDLVSWTRDVMRIEGLEQAMETAQGKAFFEWLRLFSRMAVGGMIQAYEGEYGKERYVLDANKALFVYGWGYCDTTSRIAEAAWQEYKRDARAAERVITQHEDGGYHTMFRLRMDGRYGAFDPRYGYYLVERDEPGARVLDWAEVGVDENLIRNKAFRHRSRPFFEIGGLEWARALLIQPAYFDSEDVWRAAGAPKESVFGDGAYKLGTRLHSMDFVLLRGMTIERFWDNSARQFYVPAGSHTKREFPFLPAGRFYRVTDVSLDGRWPRHDPNFKRAQPYLSDVPRNERYPSEVADGRTIGQAWGKLSYAPNLSSRGFFDALTPDTTLVHSATAPYLRPVKPDAGGAATFEISSPYVLVNGTLESSLVGAGVRLELRTLRPKNSNAAELDIWSVWQVLTREAGRSVLELGKPRFNGTDVSIHGVYRFQLRVVVDKRVGRSAQTGLAQLRLELFFENGIMSIPRIFAGTNTLRFRVGDSAALQGPVEVVYRYQTAAGKKISHKVLRPGDFLGNQATYTLSAPGLVRCNALAISY